VIFLTSSATLRSPISTSVPILRIRSYLFLCDPDLFRRDRATRGLRSKLLKACDDGRSRS
jgi:hypothetical protein